MLLVWYAELGGKALKERSSPAVHCVKLVLFYSLMARLTLQKAKHRPHCFRKSM